MKNILNNLILSQLVQINIYFQKTIATDGVKTTVGYLLNALLKPFPICIPTNLWLALR